MTASGLLTPEVGLADYPAFWEGLHQRAKHGLAWESVAAGLLTLRAIDAYASTGPLDAEQVRRVCERIEALSPDEPTRTSLLALMQSRVLTTEGHIGDLGAALFAYARALEFEASWKLAVEVYGLCLRNSQYESDPMLGRVYIRLGRCYLCLESISRAYQLIELGKEIALDAGNLEVELLAEMALCRMAALRGNLPLAEQLADQAITRATRAQLQAIQSRGLHERATIAVYRGDYHRGIMLELDALRLCVEPAEAWRIRSDIAAALIRLELIDEARTVLADVVRNSPERMVRYGAHANLLEVEAMSGDRGAFNLHRNVILSAKLPPELATAIQLQLGLGFLKLGDGDAAREHLRRAVALASEFGFGGIVIEADALLKQARAVPRPRAAYNDADVAEIRSALAAI